MSFFLFMLSKSVSEYQYFDVENCCFNNFVYSKLVYACYRFSVQLSKLIEYYVILHRVYTISFIFLYGVIIKMLLKIYQQVARYSKSIFC